ncbi:MAG: fructose,6-bisphosphatase [Thermoleophilaceae bacterium]|jgi:fructose-1,6-bisphosphatase II|nr:fructose,6-bisphosphatase [Thermoleophilaceae bacterium]MEA2388759.1 fructose,6-bisphosphatase [Thermoleophilaceae bacterium]
MPDPTGSRPDRNLAMELVRVTEYGALAAARWVGLGEKEQADGAAVDAMRLMLETVRMDGIVVIGEGEKDEAPMLYNGEQIGDGSPPQVDIAVDPLEGTTLAAEGTPRALAVMAMSERGTMFDPGPCVYMLKMAAQRAYRDVLDLDRPLAETLTQVAKVKGTAVRDVTVMMLKRDRHKDAVAEIRAAGARIRFIDHGDVSAALLAVQDDSPVDLLWGIGGTPEGVISAASIKCMGGVLIGRLWPRNDGERQAAIDQGYDLDEVLDQDRLVAGNDVFFAATGVTDGDVLDGVHYTRDGATTESLVMRSRSGTVRRVSARHDRAKLREISGERAG